MNNDLHECVSEVVRKVLQKMAVGQAVIISHNVETGHRFQEITC